MINNLVSIITPTFNCEKFIAETVESVILQTYENWEMIIVDDFSTDNTEFILKKYLGDRRIHFTKLDSNSGAAIARTKAMELAQGEYIAFLDSDDIWYPNKLEMQIHFMKENNINFSCTSYEQINEKGFSLDKTIKAIPKTDYKRLLLDCPVGNSTVMYNVSKMGKFSVPNIRKRNDDALWLKMLKEEQYIYGLSTILTKYRIRKNAISSNKFLVIKYHWILYREIEHIGVFKSSFHIIYWVLIKILKIK